MRGCNEPEGGSRSSPPIRAALVSDDELRRQEGSGDIGSLAVLPLKEEFDGCDAYTVEGLLDGRWWHSQPGYYLGTVEPHHCYVIATHAPGFVWLSVDDVGLNPSVDRSCEID